MIIKRKETRFVETDTPIVQENYPLQRCEPIYLRFTYGVELHFMSKTKNSPRFLGTPH